MKYKINDKILNYIRYGLTILFLIVCINAYHADYSVYHEYLVDQDTNFKYVSNDYYYLNGINGLNFNEPDKLRIKGTPIFYKTEILYTNHLIFTNYTKTYNYPIMSYYEDTDYLTDKHRYTLVIKTPLITLKKDVTDQFY